MGNLSIRNLDDAVIDRLKTRASRHGRSMEEEVRSIVSEAVKPSRAEWLARLDKIKANLTKQGRTFSDSSVLIREDRDSR
jgi:plasmid stability protein